MSEQPEVSGSWCFVSCQYPLDRQLPVKELAEAGFSTTWHGPIEDDTGQVIGLATAHHPLDPSDPRATQAALQTLFCDLLRDHDD